MNLIEITQITTTGMAGGRQTSAYFIKFVERNCRTASTWIEQVPGFSWQIDYVQMTIRAKDTSALAVRGLLEAPVLQVSGKRVKDTIESSVSSTRGVCNA